MQHLFGEKTRNELKNIDLNRHSVTHKRLISYQNNITQQCCIFVLLSQLLQTWKGHGQSFKRIPALGFKSFQALTMIASSIQQEIRQNRNEIK